MTLTFIKEPRTKEDMVPETTEEEELARFLCELDNCDPESVIPTGIGRTIEQGFPYTLWEYRVPNARAILKWLDERCCDE